MDKITQILENVVRCKYFEAGVHIKNPIKNSYQDGLGKTTQTLDHVVVVHISISDKRKSQINKYSDIIIVWIIMKVEKFGYITLYKPLRACTNYLEMYGKLECIYEINITQYKIH